MALTLNNYIQHAENLQNKARVEVHGDQLSAKGTSAFRRFFMNRTGDRDVNQATASSFLNAVKARYGEHVGEVVKGMDFIQNAITKGKPLTARMIRVAVDSATKAANNLEKMNAARIQDFKNDAGPDGLGAMVKAKAAELGMTWLTKAAGELDTVVNQIRFPVSNTPHSVQKLREAAPDLVAAKLAQVALIHTENMNVLKEFEATENAFIDKLLATPLKEPLAVKGGTMTITLKENFSKEELESLIGAAKRQVREMAGSTQPMTVKDLQDAATITLTRSNESPPDPSLISGIGTRLAIIGLTSDSETVSRIKSLAVMYGFHTTAGLEKGLALAKELSEKLDDLAAITEPAKLLRVLGDLGDKAFQKIPKGESVPQILSFAFKSALLLGNADTDTARRIYDMLSGPVAKELEVPACFWKIEANNSGSPTQELISFTGAHMALQGAAREAAGLRTIDQPHDTASLARDVPSKLADIPAAILAQMIQIGAPCGTSGPVTEKVQQLFAKLTDAEVAQIIKASQGEKLDSLFSKDSAIAYGDLPNALLVKLISHGCNCGLELEGGRPTITAFSQVSPAVAGAIIKRCQGHVIDFGIVALLNNYLLSDPHITSLDLNQAYQNLTGTPVPNPLPSSLTVSMKGRAMERLINQHFPELAQKLEEADKKLAQEQNILDEALALGQKKPGKALTAEQKNVLQGRVQEQAALKAALLQEQTALLNAFSIGLTSLGMTVPAIVSQINGTAPLSMNRLSQNSLPSLGNPVAIERDLATIHYDVARDIGRRAMSGGYSINFGNGTVINVAQGGANLPENERKDFRTADIEKNIFAARVVAEIGKLCGDNVAQKGAVATLFTASPLVIMRGVGKLIHKQPNDKSIHEHSPFNTTLQKQQDGSILATLSFNDDAYDIRMSYLVQPDGSSKMANLHMGRKA